MKTFLFCALLVASTAHATIDNRFLAWSQTLSPDTRIAFVNSRLCLTLADIALSVSKLRDAGLPRDELYAKVNRMRASQAAARMVVDYAYDNPGISPMDIYVDVGMACKKVY
jgi:hypothetical protein